MVQSPTKYTFLATVDVDSGDTVVPPAIAPDFKTQTPSTLTSGKIRHKYLVDNQQDLADFSLLPVAIDDGGGALLDGSGYLERAFRASSDEILSGSFEVASAAGIVATLVYNNVWRFSIDPAFRAGSPSGQSITASITMRARYKRRPTQFLTWPAITISTTGSQVTTLAPPNVISQPSPRSFPEGVATQFTVDIASHFTVAATPATYAVQNGDGSALTGYTLNSLVNGLATLTSPLAAGVQNIRFVVTDAQGRTNSVAVNYTVVANPLPVVVSAVTGISIDISQSGNFALSGASVIADPAGEALTYSLRNSDGTAPPAGYSFNGSNIAYPVEGGAVTRSFVIRAVETGPLARTVDSPAFTFDRPAMPVTIIDPVATLSFPENATTSIDVDVRTALGTDAAEDVTIPAIFTGKIGKAALGAGVFRLTGTFANNDILSAQATYSGTNAGNPVQGFPTFRSIHNPPVDGLPASIDALTTGPSVLDIIAQSDDPVRNLLVSGSALINIGQATISADFKQLTLTPEGPATATATLTYLIEATSGGPQTLVTKTINWRQPIGPQAVVASISTQSTDGVLAPNYNIASNWIAGDFPLNVASVKFYDIDDLPLTSTATVAGAGTMSISSAGVATFVPVAGFVGALNYSVGISDTGGNNSILPWTHTQLANPGAPPPGTVFPNTLDGKPITQVGVETAARFGQGMKMLLKNQRQANEWDAVTGQRLWTTNLKGAAAKVTDGESDMTTGWFMLAPGETTYMEQPRYYQNSGHADVRTGDWSIQWDVRTGDVADFANITGAFGWPEAGTVTGIAGGQSDFINGGAPFTFTRRRFIRTLTTADTTGAVLSVTNNSGTNIWVRYWYSGRVSDETTWQAQPATAEGISDGGEEKIHRYMDISSPAGRAGRAIDMVHKGDYLFTANGRSFVAATSPLAQNSNYFRQGAPVFELAKIQAARGAALWVNVPMTLGMNLTAGDPNGFYTASAKADPFANPVTDPIGLAQAQAYALLISQNFDAIISEAKVQFRLLALEYIQNLIDAGYPDNSIFYLELANEIWNVTNFRLSFNYANAIKDHLVNRTDGKPVYSKASQFLAGAGYICNLMANEFLKVVAELKPNQQIEFIVGAQTAGGFSKARAFVEGWNIFSAEFPLASQPADRLAGTTTNYLSGAFGAWNTTRSPGAGNPFGSATFAEYATAYNAARAVSQDNLFQICRDWYVNPASRNSSVAGQLLFISQVVPAFTGAGARYIGNYEGSFADTPIGSEITAIPTILGDKRAFFFGSYGEEVQAYFNTQYQALYPGKIISNYYKYNDTPSTFGSGSSWFEKTLDQYDVAPTTGVAKAFYDISRKGGGSISPPTNLDETFETASRTSLIAAGWTLGSGFSVLNDGFGDLSLYSAGEFDTAGVTLGTSLQANAIRAVRLVMRPDGARTAEYGRLIMSSTGDYVAIKPGASGAMTLTFLGQGAANALTTTGLDLLDGNFHDLTITYYAHATAGLVEVKRTSDNFVYGSFSGNTISTVTAGASPHIETIELRGKVYWGRVANLTGVAPPVVSTEWETTATLADSDIEAGFVWDIDLTQLSGGAAHQLFQKAQANGGDLRVYLADKTTRIPLHIMSFNKTAGTGRLRVRTPSAMTVGAVIKIKSGGDGTLTQPAADAAFGSREVYQDFDLYTTDMTVNHATGEVFTQAGGAVTAGPNGLSARGYDSQGVNAGDATTSTLTTNGANMSAGLLFKRAAKGGGGVGVADTGFARLFHMQNGDDLYIRSDNGRITLEVEFDSGTDSNWATPYATLNAWAGFCYSRDGSTSNPIFTLNAANAAVTVVQAPVGSVLAGNTTLVMGNHNGFNRNWDGRLCEYWRRSATTTQAYHIAWQRMMLGLATFITYDAGAAW